MTDISKLHEELQSSEALQIHFRLQILQDNFYIVSQNHNELSSLLKAAQDPKKFWLGDKRKELKKMLPELSRLLLNFITSSSARIGNTRRVLGRAYKNTPFMFNYQAEVNRRFRKNHVSKFVEDLRNYSFHYSIPLAGAYWGVETDLVIGEAVPYQAFTLDKAQLMAKNYKWKKGLPFLENNVQNYLNSKSSSYP